MNDFIIDPGAIVISCQAAPDNPFRGSCLMALMGRAAAAGGAGGIRANGAADIVAIRDVVQLPIVGLNKIGDPSGVFITPTYESAAEVVSAGADLVALDGTRRPRPGGQSLNKLVAQIHADLGVPVMADVDSYEAGVEARLAGADFVATTLSGYTGGPVPSGPDVDLVGRLVAGLDCPVVAEGRYWTPEDVRAAFAAGAYAVVVGTAVTNPMAITRRLVGR